MRAPYNWSIQRRTCPGRLACRGADSHRQSALLLLPPTMKRLGRSPTALGCYSAYPAGGQLLRGTTLNHHTAAPGALPGLSEVDVHIELCQRAREAGQPGADAAADPVVCRRQQPQEPQRRQVLQAHRGEGLVLCSDHQAHQVKQGPSDAPGCCALPRPSWRTVACRCSAL